MSRPVLLLQLGAAALPELEPVGQVYGTWAPAVYTPPVVPGPELVIEADGTVIVNCKYSDFHLLLTANVTGFVFINVGDGDSDSDVVTIDIEQTGAFTVVVGDQCAPITAVPYAVTATFGAIDVLGFKTFDRGATWLYTVQQPAAGAVAVVLSPSPASDTDDNDGSTPSAPSVQVTATPNGGSAPITHAWTRADSGGSDFLIDDATAAAPTFSIAAGTAPFSATQSWRDTVTDGAGATAQATVEVTLVRTSPLPATGDWDGAAASATSVRVAGPGASARAWLQFKTDGTWELWSQAAPSVPVLEDSGTWGAGVDGSEYEVRFTPSDEVASNDAADYADLASAREIEASVFAPPGVVQWMTWTIVAELRRADTPGTVTSGEVTIELYAERDAE